MRRPSWFIAIMAALFVLQAPLCALACFENADADPSTVTERSCHDEPSDSSPSGESNSHADCGCNFVSQALVSQPTVFNPTPPPVDLVVSSALRSELIYSSGGREPHIAQEADLPPPDILLLKSTLII
jgi:hypothetical protein